MAGAVRVERGPRARRWEHANANTETHPALIALAGAVGRRGGDRTPQRDGFRRGRRPTGLRSGPIHGTNFSMEEPPSETTHSTARRWPARGGVSLGGGRCGPELQQHHISSVRLYKKPPDFESTSCATSSYINAQAHTIVLSVNKRPDPGARPNTTQPVTERPHRADTYLHGSSKTQQQPCHRQWTLTRTVMTMWWQLDSGITAWTSARCTQQ